MLVMCSQQEKDFLNTYGTFGEKDKPCAIVPKSARKLYGDSEGYLIYSVVVLKKFIPVIQQICRENRYTLRTFDIHEMNNAKEDDDEIQLVQLEAEEKKIKVGLIDWIDDRLIFCNGAVPLTLS